MSVTKFFPINTETSCQLKWNWSTLYLYSGLTQSCCRSTPNKFYLENFHQFHNTEEKIKDRQQMLMGQWPESGSCNYCSEYENVGGFSERQRHAMIPDMSPPELVDNPLAVSVTPTILEVYFDYTCNMGCLYCRPQLSSVINQENKKHGIFDSHGVKLEHIAIQSEYDQTLAEFWNWMSLNSRALKRFSILGGEPFYQSQFETCIEYFENNPHPELELGIVTNLMIDNNKLESWIQRFENMMLRRKVKRIDITCSIDCWGPEQEFVRWGLDLSTWEKNFETLIQHKSIVININQTISVLTIKTMPDLLEKLQHWRQYHDIGQWFGLVDTPTWLNPTILGPNVFDKDFVNILKLMPRLNEFDNSAWQLMSSIDRTIQQSIRNNQECKKLKVFLNEKDRRRGTDWKKQFAWLEEELKNVV